MINRPSLLFICVLLLLPVATTAEPIVKQYSFSELVKKEALFELYQGHYFPAISYLLTSRKNNSLTIDDDEYELILAGLYISFGLDSEAEKIFNKRLSKIPHRKLRNQAMLLIAKLQFRNGLYELAEKTLKKVQAQLSPKQQEERLLLHGQLLQLRSKYRWSVARLQKINNKSEWAVYGRYNLAITLIKLDDSLKGQSLLEAIGLMDATTEDMRALRDRANLTLGFWFLEHKQSENALRILNRIRLNSPATSMGLLGAGWAYYQQTEYTVALSIWQRLLNKDGLESAAAHEAQLAIAYTYLKLKSNHTALQRFEGAIKHYDAAISQLSKEIALLNSGDFFKGSGKHQNQLGEAWINWAFMQSVTANNSSLVPILNSHLFISTLNNLRDLLFLDYSLDLWSAELNTFNAALNKSAKKSIKDQLKVLTHESKKLLKTQNEYSRIISRTKRANSQLDLSTTSNLLTYKEMLFDIDVSSKNRHAATGTERLMLQKQQSQLNMIRRFTKEDKSSQKIHDTLEQIIQWQGEDLFEENLSLSRNAITDIEMKLSIVEKRKQAILMLQQAEKSDIRAYKESIKKNREKIKALQPRLNGAISAQIAQLTELATHELTSQKKRLHSYLIRAHFSVARIHDKALGSEVRSW
jgi:tetratricopeptide (TPR) repeat protein